MSNTSITGECFLTLARQLIYLRMIYPIGTFTIFQTRKFCPENEIPDFANLNLYDGFIEIPTKITVSDCGNYIYLVIAGIEIVNDYTIIPNSLKYFLNCSALKFFADNNSLGWHFNYVLSGCMFFSIHPSFPILLLTHIVSLFNHYHDKNLWKDSLIKNMNNNQIRSCIKPGASVLIVLKKDQPTGKLTHGIVDRILTNSTYHPRGIKVMLTDGQVGRVQIIENI